MNPKRRREIRKAESGPWDPLRPAVAADTGRHEMELAGETFQWWKNNLYTVLLRLIGQPLPNWPPMVHLSIRRNDRRPVTDWRDVQRIKNDLCGPECEGAQLFPAESRLVDTSNQFHLYVLATPGQQFPFGYRERAVTEVSSQGAVQRPFRQGETPADALDRQTVDASVDAIRSTIR